MYDIAIIGAGPGGYETAIYAANHNLKVCIIEKDNLGGTCLNHGCIPTKTYFTASKIIHQIKNSNVLGIKANYDFNFLDLYVYKEKVINDLLKGIEFKLQNPNIDIINGIGELIKINDKIFVKVNDKTIEANNYIIATGSSPLRNIIPNDDLTISSKELLELKEIPKNLCIIGAGVIGLEMANIFNAFGSSVHVVEMMDNILPTFDKDISKRLQTYMTKSGVTFYLKTKVNQIINSKTIEIIKKEQSTILTFDCILECVGRKPNVNNINLDSISVNYTNKGITINEVFQTNVGNIFAIGDVTGKNMLAHAASSEGKVVIDYLLKKNNKANFKYIPNTVFCIPECASIGLTEQEAIKQGINYEVHKSLYRANGKAVAMNETNGFIKALVSNDVLIGVSIIGENASDIIHEAAIIMNAGLKLQDVEDIIFAHPTLSEVFKDILI